VHHAGSAFFSSDKIYLWNPEWRIKFQSYKKRLT
jgi:hypothetical protein